MSHRDTIIIRSSTEHDAPALARLAVLDSAPMPAGRTLVAEVDGNMRAALPLDGGPAVADPFAPTAHLVELLRSHAAALDTARPATRRAGHRRLAAAAAYGLRLTATASVKGAGSAAARSLCTWGGYRPPKCTGIARVARSRYAGVAATGGTASTNWRSVTRSR
jgi:hypothetical protein